ncbi:MAG: glycosyltransferase family 2 protein [bacterium]|nr:glycosyltransferase family 2 protein [bacterium]
MTISVVIPNYNGEKILEKNLPKVLDAVGDAEVIVVDDASADGSLEVLSSYKSKIKIIKNEKNLGFSSTVNKGVKEARGEIVILLNTDVAPEKTFLKPLLYDFKDDNIFAVGCMDKSIEQGTVVFRGRGIGSWKKGFLIHSKGEVNKADTLWVGGGSGAFRKSIWEKLRGFNTLYDPFYWEDIDLSYRALKSGYKIIFEPKSVVIHEHEKGAIKSNYSNFKVKTIAYRNQFIFVWKNATDLNLQFSHLLWLPYHFVKAFVKGDKAFFIGFFTALFRLPKIISSSLEDQRMFILKDSQVTPYD